MRLSSLGGVPGSNDDHSGQEDYGNPFTRVFGTDTPEALAVRVYEEMLDLGWDEGVVRAAFKLVIKRSREGRPARQRLEPSEQHMLQAWDLWATDPDRGPSDKLGFAKYWYEEKHYGQSVNANRKLLDRLIKFRANNY